MNTIETISKRYSCRNFDGKQITESDLDLIIKAGMSAPVARGLYENLHITVVQDEALIKEIFDVTEEEMYKLSNVRRNMNFGAKTYIIVSSINPTNMEYVNAGCIVENMILAATALNINTVMMAAPTRSIADKKDLLLRLGIPSGYVPLLSSLFGYAKEDELPKEHHITINRI